ncbi:hypothetical protein [Methylobacterium sp. J-078]|nr:hypothetical protein [Methylobacterium sp. J-078]
MTSITAAPGITHAVDRAKMSSSYRPVSLASLIIKREHARV